MSTKIIVTGGTGVVNSRLTYLSCERDDEKELSFFTHEKLSETRRGAYSLLSTDNKKENSFVEIVVSLERESFLHLGKDAQERRENYSKALQAGLSEFFKKQGWMDVRYAGAIHLDTSNPHAHIVFARDAKSPDGKNISLTFRREWFWREDGQNSFLASFFERPLYHQQRDVPVSQMPTVATPAVFLPAQESDPNRIAKVLNQLTDVYRINPEKIDPLVKNQEIYVSRQGRLVFTRRDTNGLVSGYSYSDGFAHPDTNGFFYLGNPQSATRFVLVDNPIEALSAYELTSHRNLSEAVFVSLDKGSVPNALIEFLKERKDSARIILATSVDKEGLQDTAPLDIIKSSISGGSSQINFYSWTPYSDFGSTWQKQLQFRKLPGEFRAISQTISEAEASVERSAISEHTIDHSEAEETVFRGITVTRDNDTFIVNQHFADIPAEIGRYQWKINSENENEFLAFVQNGDTPTVFKDEIATIKFLREKALQLKEYFPSDSPDIEAKRNDAAESVINSAEALARKTDVRQTTRDITDSLKKLPLEDVLYSLGFSKGYDHERYQYTFKDNSGSRKIVIKDDLWRDRYNDQAGGRNAINLVMYVNGTSFADARKYLSESFGTGYTPRPHQSVITKPTEERTAKVFRLPLRDEDQLYKVTGYLAEKRAIDPEIIDSLIDTKLIYANQYGSVVFVYRDEDENILGAGWRSTQNTKRQDVAGSDKTNAYFYLGDFKTATRFIVTEAPIEAISYYQLYKEQIDFGKTVVISAGGNSLAPKLVEKINSTAGSRAEIVIAFNNDARGEAGYEAALEKLGLYTQIKNQALEATGQLKIVPFEGAITREYPTLSDWNEDLVQTRDSLRSERDRENVIEEMQSISRPELSPDPGFAGGQASQPTIFIDTPLDETVLDSETEGEPEFEEIRTVRLNPPVEFREFGYAEILLGIKDKESRDVNVGYRIKFKDYQFELLPSSANPSYRKGREALSTGTEMIRQEVLNYWMSMGTPPPIYLARDLREGEISNEKFAAAFLQKIEAFERSNGRYDFSPSFSVVSELTTIQKAVLQKWEDLAEAGEYHSPDRILLPTRDKLYSEKAAIFELANKGYLDVVSDGFTIKILGGNPLTEQAQKLFDRIENGIFEAPVAQSTTVIPTASPAALLTLPETPKKAERDFYNLLAAHDLLSKAVDTSFNTYLETESGDAVHIVYREGRMIMDKLSTIGTAQGDSHYTEWTLRFDVNEDGILSLNSHFTADQTKNSLRTLTFASRAIESLYSKGFLNAVIGDAPVPPRPETQEILSADPVRLNRFALISEGQLPSIIPGTADLASHVNEILQQGESIGNNVAFDRLAEKYFNSTLASGAFSSRDAYDALEAGVNLYLLNQASEIRKMPPAEAVGFMEGLLRQLPTQTSRTEEQKLFQQFSTPPTFSYLVNLAAGLKESDVVLEPSAGTGSLAIWAKAIGAELHVNEISERRRDILRLLGHQNVYNRDAEFADSTFPIHIAPTVVMMNPPFSSTGGRMGDKNNTKYGIRHIDQALLRLSDGGRLVAITGEGMAFGVASREKWWADTLEKYNVRANLTLPENSYAKYGTSFGNQLIIIDKTGPTPGDSASDRISSVLVKTAASFDEIVNDLAAIGSERNALQDQPKENIEATDIKTSYSSVPVITEDIELEIDTPVEVIEKPISLSSPPRTKGVESDKPEQISLFFDPTGSEQIPEESVSTALPKEASPVPEPKGTPLVFERNKERADEITPGLVKYVPAKFKGGVEHPAIIVESSSMAAVVPPDLKYQHHLDTALIEDGVLSDLQVEAVLYAGQQHDNRLPDGRRAAFFIGDGTGVGKGRELAAIALDNWNQGRKRILWLSINYDLVPSSKRDLEDLRAGDIKLSSLDKISVHQDLDESVGDGMLFSSYATLIGKGSDGQTRFDQIVRWLGEDGVILLDEGHLAKNAVTSGMSKSSQRGEAVVDLQIGAKSHPDWRFVYSSATGATEVANMGYMQRLGIWGERSGFPGGFAEFRTAIERGGLGAMEMVSRDLKASGMYLSRTISYQGVDYRTLHHELTPKQIEIYNLASAAWQDVYRSFNESMQNNLTSKSERSFAMSRFYSSQQIFYRQLMTALKVPSLLKEVERIIDKGSDYTDPVTGEITTVPAQVVLGFIGTGEARTKEQMSKAIQNDLAIEDLDFSPKSILMNVVEKAYPTTQFVEKVSSDGNTTTREALVDQDGRPIENRQAVIARDALLQKLQEELVLPENPLDQIVNYFGPSNVAEITGRKKRLVYDQQTGKTRYERRARKGVSMEKASQDEMNAFQQGRKKIAIISQAASTGISLHADKRSESADFRRVQITVETSWSADMQMQIFGRTHRSNQSYPPEYVLASTNIGGEKRFLSTIAKRLASLGALTKGDRAQAGGGDLSKFDFENSYGQASAEKTVRDLERGTAEWLQDLPRNPETGDPQNTVELLYRIGFAKKEADRYFVTEETYRDLKVSRFLNRLLMLDVKTQNAIFDQFARQQIEFIERDKELGLFDDGIHDLDIQDITFAQEPSVVHVSPSTGAETIYYKLTGRKPTEPVAIEDLEKRIRENNARSAGVKPLTDIHNGGFIQNKHSKNILYVEYQTTHTDPETSEQMYIFKTIRPRGETNERLTHKEIKENFTRVDPKKTAIFGEGDIRQVAAWWNQKVDETPAFRETPIHLIGGSVLPIWQRLNTAKGNGSSSLQTVRVITNDGERLLGVHIPSNSINTVLRDLGVSQSTQTPEEIYDLVFNQKDVVSLVSGLKIRPSVLKKNPAIEITYANDFQRNDFKRAGAFEELINFSPRTFIPTEKEAAIETIGKILETYPAISEDPQLEQHTVGVAATAEARSSAESNIQPMGRAAQNPDAEFFIEAESFFDAPVHTYWHKIDIADRGDGSIKVNPAGYAFIRNSVLLSDPTNDVIFKDGLYFSPEQKDELLATFDKQSEDTFGYNRESVSQITKTIASAASKTENGSFILLAEENAREHELFHHYVALASEGREIIDQHDDFKSIATHPAFQKAYLALAKEYPTSSLPYLTEELAAWSSRNEAGYFGLSDPEQQAYLKTWFTSFAARNGMISKEQFKEITDDTRAIRDAAYEAASRDRKSTHHIPGRASEGEIDRSRSLGRIQEIDDRKPLVRRKAGRRDLTNTAGREYILELRVKAAEAEEVKLATDHRESVSINGNTLSRLDTEARLYGETRVQAASRTGIYEEMDSRTRESAQAALYNNSVKQAVTNQLKNRAAILKLIDERRSQAEKNLVQAKTNLRAFRASNPDPKPFDLESIKIDPALVWKEQERALLRGDLHSFNKLESMNAKNGLPRTNDAFARLKGLALIEDARESSANFGSSSPSAVRVTLGSKPTASKEEKKAEIMNRADRHSGIAKQLRSDALREALRPLTNQLNPMSNFNGTLSWFTDPVGTFDRLFNPITRLKNDPAVQIVRAAYKTIDNIANAKAHEKAAQETLRSAEKLLDEKSNPVREAVKSEERLRQSMSANQPASNLDSPSPALSDDEVRQIADMVKSGSDNATLEKFLSDTSPGNSLSSLFTQTAEAGEISSLRASIMARDSIQSVEVTDAGVELTIDPAKAVSALRAEEAANINASINASISDLDNPIEKIIDPEYLAERNFLAEQLKEELPQLNDALEAQTESAATAINQARAAQAVSAENLTGDYYLQKAITDAEGMFRDTNLSPEQQLLGKETVGQNFINVEPALADEKKASDFWKEKMQEVENDAVRQKRVERESMTAEERLADQEALAAEVAEGESLGEVAAIVI